jgi:O-antigen/teichoic acid export membrane protein
MKVNEVVKGTFLYTFSNLFIKFGAVLILPLVTRILTPEEFGILSIMEPISQLISFLVIGGLYISQSREYVHLRKNEEELGKYLFTVNAFMLIVSIVVFCLVSNNFSSDLIGRLVNYDVNDYLYLFVLIGIIKSFVLMANTFFQQQRKYMYISIVSIVGFFIDLILTILLVQIFDLGLVGRSLAILGGTVFILLITYFNYMKYFRFTFNKEYLNVALVVSMPMIVSSIFGFINNYSDRFILGAYVPVESVGNYSLAYNGAMVISVFITSFNNAWIPIFNERMDKNKNDRSLKEMLIKFITFLSAISLTGILFGNYVISIIFTEEYHGATDYFPYLIATMILQGLYHYLVLFFNFYRETKIVATITIISSIINLLINLIFIPMYGVMVAIISTFVAFLINVILLTATLKRRYKVTFNYKKIIHIFIWVFNPVLFYLINLNNGLITILFKVLYLSIFLVVFKKDLGILVEYLQKINKKLRKHRVG